MIVLMTCITSLMVILTKWFDCTTTLRHIHGVAMESNPIARALIYRFGVKGTVWLFSFRYSLKQALLALNEKSHPRKWMAFFCFSCGR